MFIFSQNRKNGTLYVGMTSDLIKRVLEHKNNLVDSFSKTYKTHMLVFFVETEGVESAIKREKQIKKWRCDWKVELVEKNNPDWKDLYEGII